MASQPPGGPDAPPVAEPIDPATVAGQEIPGATPVRGGAPGPSADQPVQDVPLRPVAPFPQSGAPEAAAGASFPGSADQANPFAFIRERPSGPEGAGAASRVYEAARRRRRQNVAFVIVAVVLVAASSAGGLWWLASIRTGVAPADARSSVPAAQKPQRKKKAPKIAIPEVDELLGIVGEQPAEPASRVAGEAAPAETPASAGTDASQKVNGQGDVAVEGTEAGIGRPQLARGGRTEATVTRTGRPDAGRAGKLDAAGGGQTGPEGEKPHFGPIPIPGLESPEPGASDGEPASGFDEDPGLMEAGEALRQEQAEARQKRNRGRPEAARRHRD